MVAYNVRESGLCKVIWQRVSIQGGVKNWGH